MPLYKGIETVLMSGLSSVYIPIILETIYELDSIYDY